MLKDFIDFEISWIRRESNRVADKLSHFRGKFIIL